MEPIKLILQALVVVLGLVGLSFLVADGSWSGSGSTKKIIAVSFNIASPAAIGYAVPVVGKEPVTFNKNEDPEHTKKRIANTVEKIKELMKKASIIALQEAHYKEYVKLMRPHLLDSTWMDTANINGCVILYNKNLYEPYSLKYKDISQITKIPEHLLKVVAVKRKGDNIIIVNVHLLAGKPSLRRALLTYIINKTSGSSLLCIGDYNTSADTIREDVSGDKNIEVFGTTKSSYSRFTYRPSPADANDIGYGKWKRNDRYVYNAIDLAITRRLQMIDDEYGGELQIPTESDFVQNETPYANPTEDLQTVPNYDGWTSDHAAKLWRFEVIP